MAGSLATHLVSLPTHPALSTPSRRHGWLTQRQDPSGRAWDARGLVGRRPGRGAGGDGLITVPRGPQGIAISSDGSMAYAADNTAGTLTPIIVATDMALPAITGVGTRPRELAITPVGSTAYVADNGSSKVHRVPLPSGPVGKAISVGQIAASGMQDVFGKHGVDLHGSVSINLAGNNAWQCKINGGGSGDSGGDILIDPSGFVRTASGGLPVPGARVTLQRRDSHGVFSAPLTGQSSIFSPAINPEFTDALGHYGWNVAPGRYRVRVRRSGCRSKTSRVVTVPPPVSTLTVALRCRGLRRASTTLAAHLIGKARSGRGAVLVVAIHTRRPHGLAGYVTVRAGGKSYTIPVAGTETTIGVPGLRAGHERVAISYSGDGYRQASRRRMLLVVKR